MTKKLTKKLSTLFIIFLTIIWSGILLFFIHSTYRSNLMELKDDFRNEMRDIKFNHFIESKGDTLDLNDIEYCVFSLDHENSPHILFNTFSNKSDSELLHYGNKLAANWKKNKRFLKYTYIYKFKRNTNQRYIILISGTQAMKDTLPTLILCLILLAVGILVFSFASKIISRLLVQPVENMINSEKNFISNASHELKTPLTVIRANTELLSSEIGNTNKHLEYISQETERMISLINKMLTLVRLDSTQIQENTELFCVDEALLDIIYPMESIAYEKSITISTDIKENMFIKGNKEQIQNVMSILLNNAISYTPADGQIYIHAELHSKKLYLDVANSGDSIPEDIRNRLFERFFRADEARQDNGHFGLGLSIASSIVSHYSGKISVDRKNDMNVFSVVLPSSETGS